MTSPFREPSRGDVWQVNLDPVRGREQRGERPAVVISMDKFNHGPSELVIIVPITKQKKNILSHVFIGKGQAGLELDSYAKVEDIRSISRERLVRYRGDLAYPHLEQIQRLLRVLLGL